MDPGHWEWMDFSRNPRTKTFPRELAISDRNLDNWKLLRIKTMDLWKGEGDSFFLRLDLGSSFKISKHLAGKWWRFFQKSRGSWGIFFHFFPPILVVKDCGNATKHEFTLPSRFLRRGLGWVEFVQFGTFLTEKTVAQVLHHWICSLVPIDGGHVFCQSVVLNLEFFRVLEGFLGSKKLDDG